MVTRRNSYYSDPAIGAGVEALAEGIFGGGEREVHRARAGLLREQATGASFENQRFQRRAQNAAALRDLLASGPPADPEGRAAWNRQVYSLRAEDDANQQTALPAFMRGFVHTQPLVPQAERDAAVVGAGGSWLRDTETGGRFSEGESTRRAGIAAGATVRSQQIAQEGANFRFLHGDVNPGADGVVVGGRRAQALNLVPPPPQMAPGEQGPPMPAPPPAPFFVPGAATIAPGNVRQSPAPGPLVPGQAPVMVETQGNPTLPTEQGRAAQQILAPETPPEQRARATSILPGVAAAEVRGQTAREVAGIRAGAAQLTARIRADNSIEIERMRQDGQLERVELQNASREEIAALLADSRVAAQVEASIGRVEAARIRAEAAGARGAGANRTIGEANERAIRAAIDEVLTSRPGGAVSLDPAAREWVNRRTQEIFGQRSPGQGGSAAVAAQQAVEEYFRHGSALPRTDHRWMPGRPQYGLPPSLVPPAAGAARPQVPAAPQAPAGRPSVVPPAATQTIPPAELLEQARSAIQRGANRDQVIQRLRAAGVDPAGL
jgi:hypothetical protein